MNILKALVYEGIKKVSVKQVPDPEIINNDDIIVKVSATTICGSDLHLYHGMIPHLEKNTILGHETMGIVEEIGKDVYDLHQGDRVTIPFPIACGHCWYCENEYYSQCDNSNKYGNSGSVYGYSKMMGGYEGGQAEYLRVPYANLGALKVPESVSDEHALLITDVLPTAYWCVENSGVKTGDTVVILGCGPIGLITIKWSYFFGAKRVIAVDHVKYRLDKAKEYGADVINFENQEYTGDLIKEMTKGGADVVIDCVGMGGKISTFELIETALRLQGGSKSAIELASQAVRKNGTVFLVGVYGSRYNQFPLGDFFNKNITLKMGLCPAHKYIPKILDLVSSERFYAADILTHRLNLENISHAYNIFDKKEDCCIKVLIKP